MWLAGAVVFGGLSTRAVADPPSAAQFYQSHCANCHGANGRNPALQKIFPDMPDFTNSRWQAAHTKADLVSVILHGREAMPAYQGDLGGLRAGQLVEYLRKFAPKGKAGSPKAAASGDPSSAAQFYQSHCANCHGANGRNPALQKIFPDIPDFTNSQWQAAHTKAGLVSVILHGREAMPAYQGDLGGLRAGQLVEYLRKFAPKGRKPEAVRGK
jgi:mono/diheme cytochrome c family protein